MLNEKGNFVNKQAAKNTAIFATSMVLAGAAFAIMMVIAPMLTAGALLLVGMAFLIQAVYRIECGRIECERRQEELRNLR